MKRTLTYLTLTLLALLQASAATADQVLAGVRKAMFAKPSVELMFTLTSEGAATQGSATIQGAMFTFATPALMAWYDGTTQWALQRANEEVSISEPTVDELMALNPFGILAQPHTYYNVSILRDTKTEVALKMVPKSKGTGITNIVVTCTPTTYAPKAIEITFDDHRTMRMTIDRLTPGAKLPASTFKYNPQLHPAREIIDLR